MNIKYILNYSNHKKYPFTDITKPISEGFNISIDLTEEEFSRFKSPKRLSDVGVENSYQYGADYPYTYEVIFTSISYLNVVDLNKDPIVMSSGTTFTVLETLLKDKNRNFYWSGESLGPKVIPAILLTDKIQKIKRFKY